MIHVIKKIWYWKINGYINYFIKKIVCPVFTNLKGQQHQEKIFLKEKNQITSNLYI
jgi:hypothetical protein